MIYLHITTLAVCVVIGFCLGALLGIMLFAAFGDDRLDPHAPDQFPGDIPPVMPAHMKLSELNIHA